MDPVALLQLYTYDDQSGYGMLWVESERGHTVMQSPHMRIQMFHCISYFF